MDLDDDVKGRRRMLNLDSFDSEEKRLLESLSSSLRRDFPNPSRAGCPDIAVLRGLAAKSLSQADIRKWLPHLSTCGECFRQFEDLQQRASAKKQKRKPLWIAAAAAVLFIAMIAGYFVLRNGGQTGTPGTEILDLRHIAPVSEAPELQTANVLVLHRTTRHVVLKQTKYLQELTIEEVAVFNENGATLFDTTTTPQVQDQILVVRFDLDLNRFEPGYYRLALRRPGVVWTEYRLSLR
jgi:hypothetical protein